MNKNPLKQLEELGQSLWLDYIRRDLINSGELRRLIQEDGLRGLTSNPSIFEKAMLENPDYENDIRAMVLEGNDSQTIYESLTQDDIRKAADEFKSVYVRTNGGDGYVSLEVNPHLAHDAEGTMAEARRLWTAVERPNIFIKVPATLEGLQAIKQLISEGINVNVTLLFGLPRYRKVTEAYINGIETRLAQAKPVNHIASVASFFVSRIDTIVDSQLERMIAQGGEHAELAKKTMGQVATASARVAYQIYKQIFNSEHFKKLADQGARPQRVLWASTGTKNPNYSDVKYIESLIGPNTINTAPLDTINAYRDHGKPQVRIEHEVDLAVHTLEQLPKLDINIDKVTQQLEDEGVSKFNQPFDRLMKKLEDYRNEYKKGIRGKY